MEEHDELRVTEQYIIARSILEAARVPQAESELIAPLVVQVCSQLADAHEAVRAAQRQLAYAELNHETLVEMIRLQSKGVRRWELAPTQKKAA
jgi:hypothetical protein